MLVTTTAAAVSDVITTQQLITTAVSFENDPGGDRSYTLHSSVKRKKEGRPGAFSKVQGAIFDLLCRTYVQKIKIKRPRGEQPPEAFNGREQARVSRDAWCFIVDLRRQCPFSSTDTGTGNSSTRTDTGIQYIY